MKSEWRMMKLGDMCKISSSKRIFAKEYCGDGIPFYRGKEIIEKHKGYAVSTELFISEERYAQIKEQFDVPKIGDILLSSVGTLGIPWLVDEEKFYFKDGNLTWLRAGKGLDNKFLYLWLCSPEAKRQIDAKCIGSTQKAITIQALNKFDIRIPDIDTQRKISDLLFTINNKINLNDKMNRNLAEQSQGILSEFMENNPYNLVPLEELAEIIDCLHSKKPEAVNNTTLQLLQLNNITDSGFLDLSYKYYISEPDYKNWTRKCEISEGDCVITNVGRIGAVSQAPSGTHAAMGRNMTCIRLKKDKPFHSYIITALLSNHIRKEIIRNTDEGTIMGALNVKNIPLLMFPSFERSVMELLEEILLPIRKMIEQNSLSNQALSQMRDTLLPKLISGELNVSNIPI